jgi:hypothetical protein
MTKRWANAMKRFTPPIICNAGRGRAPSMCAIMRVMSGIDVNFAVRRWAALSAGDQHDLAYRPAARALDTGKQLRLAGDSAAAVVAQAGEEVG